MTRFTDGPAKGKVLYLHRSPVLLRVTMAGETVDALDQLEDSSRAEEQLHCYVLTGPPYRAFVDGAKIHGCYSCGSYKLFAPQPDGAIMRDNQKWAAWCDSQRESLIANNEWLALAQRRLKP